MSSSGDVEAGPTEHVLSKTVAELESGVEWSGVECSVCSVARGPAEQQQDGKDSSCGHHYDTARHDRITDRHADADRDCDGEDNNTTRDEAGQSSLNTFVETTSVSTGFCRRGLCESLIDCHGVVLHLLVDCHDDVC